MDESSSTNLWEPATLSLLMNQIQRIGGGPDSFVMNIAQRNENSAELNVMNNGVIGMSLVLDLAAVVSKVGDQMDHSSGELLYILYSYSRLGVDIDLEVVTPNSKEEILAMEFIFSQYTMFENSEAMTGEQPNHNELDSERKANIVARAFEGAGGVMRVALKSGGSALGSTIRFLGTKYTSASLKFARPPTVGAREAKPQEVAVALRRKAQAEDVHAGARTLTSAALYPVRWTGRKASQLASYSESSESTMAPSPVKSALLDTVAGLGNGVSSVCKGLTEALSEVGSAIGETALTHSKTMHGDTYAENVTQHYVDACAEIGMAGYKVANVASFGVHGLMLDAVVEGTTLMISLYEYLVGPVLMQGYMDVVQPPFATRERVFAVLRPWSLSLYKDSRDFTGKPFKIVPTAMMDTLPKIRVRGRGAVASTSLGIMSDIEMQPIGGLKLNSSSSSSLSSLEAVETVAGGEGGDGTKDSTESGAEEEQRLLTKERIDSNIGESYSSSRSKSRAGMRIGGDATTMLHKPRKVLAATCPDGDDRHDDDGKEEEEEEGENVHDPKLLGVVESRPPLGSSGRAAAAASAFFHSLRGGSDTHVEVCTVDCSTYLLYPGDERALQMWFEELQRACVRVETIAKRKSGAVEIATERRLQLLPKRCSTRVTVQRIILMSNTKLLQRVNDFTFSSGLRNPTSSDLPSSSFLPSYSPFKASSANFEDEAEDARLVVEDLGDWEADGDGNDVDMLFNDDEDEQGRDAGAAPQHAAAAAPQEIEMAWLPPSLEAGPTPSPTERREQQQNHGQGQQCHGQGQGRTRRRGEGISRAEPDASKEEKEQLELVEGAAGEADCEDEDPDEWADWVDVEEDRCDDVSRGAAVAVGVATPSTTVAAFPILQNIGTATWTSGNNDGGIASGTRKGMGLERLKSSMQKMAEPLLARAVRVELFPVTRSGIKIRTENQMTNFSDLRSAALTLVVDPAQQGAPRPPTVHEGGSLSWLSIDEETRMEKASAMPLMSAPARTSSMCEAEPLGQEDPLASGPFGSASSGSATAPLAASATSDPLSPSPSPSLSSSSSSSSISRLARTSPPRSASSSALPPQTPTRPSFMSTLASSFSLSHHRASTSRIVKYLASEWPQVRPQHHPGQPSAVGDNVRTSTPAGTPSRSACNESPDGQRSVGVVDRASAPISTTDFMDDMEAVGESPCATDRGMWDHITDPLTTIGTHMGGETKSSSSISMPSPSSTTHKSPSKTPRGESLTVGRDMCIDEVECSHLLLVVRVKTVTGALVEAGRATLDMRALAERRGTLRESSATTGTSPSSESMGTSEEEHGAEAERGEWVNVVRKKSGRLVAKLFVVIG